MKINTVLLLALYTTSSFAGRFEVQSEGKSVFYVSGPKVIRINNDITCIAEESNRKPRVVSIGCGYKGASFYTNEDCASDGSGFAMLNINGVYSISLIHHCNGTTIK